MSVVYDDVKLCNCASCGDEMLGVDNEELEQERIHGTVSGRLIALLPPQTVWRRINGRPYCKKCADVMCLDKRV